MAMSSAWARPALEGAREGDRFALAIDLFAR